LRMLLSRGVSVTRFQRRSMEETLAAGAPAKGVYFRLRATCWTKKGSNVSSIMFAESKGR